MRGDLLELLLLYDLVLEACLVLDDDRELVMSFPVVGDVQEGDYEQDSSGELRFPEL